MIKRHIGNVGKNEKSKIQLFFSEALAQNNNNFEFSETFKQNLEKIYNFFSNNLSKQA